MTLTIDLTPAEEARLAAEARRAGLAPAEWIKERVTERLPQGLEEVGEEGAKRAGAAALLRGWIRDDATDDPEELRRAQAELDEFKRNMNANRAATGERLVFPE